MTDVERLSDYISEEVEDACKYAKCAMAHKDIDVKLGDMYYNLSKEQMHHAALEEEQLERLLSQTQDGEWMRIAWKWEKNRIIDRKANICAMLTMYKE